MLPVCLWLVMPMIFEVDRSPLIQFGSLIPPLGFALSSIEPNQDDRAPGFIAAG